MVDWHKPNRDVPQWRRWPAWNGSGCLALPPDHALFCLRQGFLTMDGKRARVEKVDDVEPKTNLIALRICFAEGEWTEAHP